MTSSMTYEAPLAERRALALEPTRRTWLAIGSVPAMWLCYWGESAVREWSVSLSLVLFLGGGCLLVATVLPLMVNRAEGRGLSGLGITRYRWRWALLIALVSMGSLPALLDRAAGANVDPTMHLLYNLTVLWEPLFLFGWLQLTFERAFGYLCAPVLTAVAFGAYHLGSAPLGTALGFAAAGLVLGALFAVTNNLLSMWPLTWAISSGIGSIDAGLSFGRDSVVAGFIVLTVQVVLLAVIRPRPCGATGTSRPRAASGP
ncbi:CPBP family intramembrane glutamic endopeptidase [Nocardioides sp. 616]|uniref:CPBP family intramembrane glutamic endopeptidase n=1 Tax=Nocardioides sp. 616 TaxID=2268090 RepID=UPI0013B44D17|nr:CPBP family intramembrane glutamic endopeptidase [Nocardioides sp. 616]